MFSSQLIILTVWVICFRDLVLSHNSCCYSDLVLSLIILTCGCFSDLALRNMAQIQTQFFLWKNTLTHTLNKNTPQTWNSSSHKRFCWFKFHVSLAQCYRTTAVWSLNGQFHASPTSMTSYTWHFLAWRLAKFNQVLFIK